MDPVKSLSPAQDKITAKGLEWVVDHFTKGGTRMSIADELGIADSVVTTWLKKLSPAEIARVHDAQRRSAEHWDREAERVLQAAVTREEISKARELANHYRWRAKVRDPSRYGDKVQVDAQVTHVADPALIEDKLRTLVGSVAALADQTNVIDVTPTAVSASPDPIKSPPDAIKP